MYRPADAAEALEMVREAVAGRRTLEIVGGGSRREFGRQTHADAVLDLSGLAGVVAYEPEELVLTVRPATRMADLAALLAGERQHLAFEPPDLAPLWGGAAGEGTLGGALSAGLGGSRRVGAGAPRDHFLGFKAINGFGEAFAAGGRVVKNVTGYDLPKLVAGSFGTLAVLTEVTVKVLPAPEAVRTLAIAGLEEETALALLRQVLAVPAPPTGAAHLPTGMAARLPCGPLGSDPRAVTLVRLEGVEPGVAAAVAALSQRLTGSGCETALLDAQASAALWRDVSSGAAFVGSEAPVWRISCPPAAAGPLAGALRRGGVDALYFDWGGGAIWVEGGEAQAVRGALAAVAGDGHATLLRQPSAGVAEPFQPLAPGVAALTRRVKAQFDPLGLFNPGRMYEGV